MADTDDVDSTEESGAAPADRSSDGRGRRAPGQPAGSHALGGSPEPDGIEPDGIELDGVEPDGLRQDTVDDDPADDDAAGDSELVTVGASSTALAARGSKDGGAVARTRAKKVKATPKQKQLAEQTRRTGPVTFLRESVSELQKVVYPTGQQLVNYFVVVLIFVLFIIAIVSLLDLAFGKAILAVFS